MRLNSFLNPAFIFSVVLLLTNSSLCAQNHPNKKTEVLLCGTMHYIPDSLKQNWVAFRKFLEDYKPDAICVEYRMPDDSVSLTQADGGDYAKINDVAAQTTWAQYRHKDEVWLL